VLPCSKTAQSEGKYVFIIFQIISWIWTKKPHKSKMSITELYETSVLKLRERHHFMYSITSVVYFVRFWFVITVLLKIPIYREVPRCRLVNTKRSVADPDRRSSLAERYNDALCTLRLDKTGGPGFAKAKGNIPQDFNLLKPSGNFTYDQV
jgi:hypothetical protein